MGIFRMNQVGYHPKGIKTFAYLGKSDHYVIKNHVTGNSIFEGTFTSIKNDRASGDQVRLGRFDDLCETGIYQIETEEGLSEPFSIEVSFNKSMSSGLIKAFYYQRCGMELREEYAGDYAHGPCHMGKSYLFSQDVENQLEFDSKAIRGIDTRGGWHDAGDYGRYTVAAAKAVADLMMAYEQYPGAFKDSLNIPESSLMGDDLLHEIKYELDFLLKLQRQDGAVYTKVTTRYFPGMIMPEDDLDPLLIFDISSPATGDFAAAMAMASRIYRDFDAAYSQICLQAAIKAYDWLSHHPSPLFFTNPENMNSGEYGDNQDIDERYWAAIELYKATSKTVYHDDFIKYFHELHDFYTLGWADMSGYGSLSYLLGDHIKNPQVTDVLIRELDKICSKYENRSQQDGYGISLEEKDYIWGSTMILLNQTMLLIYDQHLNPGTDHSEVIENNWHYLYGMNPMDLSYVTGYGQRAVMNPHHRPSEADGIIKPLPGLVSGGPCQGLYDPMAEEACQGQPPAKCFIDHVDSYSTNEITIYWNSPAVFVSAYLVDRYK